MPLHIPLPLCLVRPLLSQVLPDVCCLGAMGNLDGAKFDSLFNYVTIFPSCLLLFLPAPHDVVEALEKEDHQGDGDEANQLPGNLLHALNYLLLSAFLLGYISALSQHHMDARGQSTSFAEYKVSWSFHPFLRLSPGTFHFTFV